MVLRLTFLVVVSLVLALIIFSINFLVFPQSSETSGTSLVKSFSAIDALFVEGLLLVVMGILDFLASGISYGSRRGVGLLAAAKDIFDDSVSVGPTELLKSNKWKKLGLMSAGSVAVITGIILLVVYFLSI